jgi:hypothetical protein
MRQADIEGGRRRKRRAGAWPAPLALAVLVVLAVTCSLILMLSSLGTQSLPSAPRGQDISVLAMLALNSVHGESAPKAQGALFPYSVIPRGAATVGELKDTLARDGLVAAHYAGFATGRARVVRAKRNRAVYLSYRLGNRIYWTKNKMLVPRGETLITDGTHFARTRCGNRISERPMAPVSPAEPTAKTFDEPSRLNVPVIPLQPFDPPALWASDDSPPWLPLAPGPAGPGGGFYVPPIPPFFCCSGGGSSPVPVTPPPLETPEPATLLLVLLGLGAAGLLRKR